MGGVSPSAPASRTGPLLSGVGFLKGGEAMELRRVWQDGFRPAYWDIATYFSELERGDVLPQGSVSMDGSGHYPHATLEQTTSGGVGVMEHGHGIGAVVWAERRE